MQTFFMMGSYSSNSIKEISANRTDRAVEQIEELGGKIISMYALLGGFDLIIIAEFDKMESAMKASMGLTCMTGVHFTTYPAVTVEDFDKMLWEGPNFYKT